MCELPIFSHTPFHPLHACYDTVSLSRLQAASHSFANGMLAVLIRLQMSQILTDSWNVHTQSARYPGSHQ